MAGTCAGRMSPRNFKVRCIPSAPTQRTAPGTRPFSRNCTARRYACTSAGIGSATNARNAPSATDEPQQARGIPAQHAVDDLGGQSFDDAVAATMVDFDEGSIVTGHVVKIDSDEVLLDIGYKSEGVIPSKEQIGRAHV